MTEAHPRELTEGDYAGALDSLTHGPDEEPKELDIHTPAEHGVKHKWLQRFVPGIEKIASEYHVGNYVMTRGDNAVKVWESMPIYVRVGMQLLYHGREQEKVLGYSKVDALLKEQSVKQGRAFDSPTNALAHIQSFIKTYSINLSELLEPDPAKYDTFNKFFYRALKAGARPVHEPENPKVVSSAADCRLTVFESVDKAKEFWIKGRNFTLPALLDDPALASLFENGPLAVFRLAPADYHRYHSPVKGRVGASKAIDGTYFTVNPVCVNEDIDVFTRNKRDVTLIHADTGTGQSLPVAFVQVGAMLVGSIVRTADEGKEVERGGEVGYFGAGSTIIAAFPPGSVSWDADLVRNSSNKMETIVRVGERIGAFV
uniref:phosphatidylserine decarboxylase n=1 Tax=Rhodotorula toruloides TaxID=5286 RepID=A0A0K3CT30_RHOTO